MSVAAQPSPIAALAEPQRKPASLWRDAWRRFFKNKLAVGALVVMAVLVVLAVGADVIAPAPYDFSELKDANQFPFQNTKHILGTDTVGRDFLSRLIYGARISLIVGFVALSLVLALSSTFEAVG